jgi:hypothetical protein
VESHAKVVVIDLTEVSILGMTVALALEKVDLSEDRLGALREAVASV